MAAIEKLMKQFTNSRVGVQDVGRKLPYISVVTNAGANAYVLGGIAKQGVLYSRTRFLANKYDLALPTNLVDPNDDEEATGVEGI